MNKGSIINDTTTSDGIIPSYIHKSNQILLSISARDYAFITEDKLSSIFGLFSDHNLSMNMMQNSAISFSVCLDYDPSKVDLIIDMLKEQFIVTYNTSVILLTIRHYSEEIIEELINEKEVLLEQRTRSTARFVVK